MQLIPAIAAVFLLESCLSLPVSEVQTNQAPIPSKEVDKSRQDGDDGDGVGEIEQVGEQVSQIISGVVSGNFGQIFSGSTGFIDDADTQTGIDTILSGLTLPLNNLFQSGLQQGQKYFNITTENPNGVQAKNSTVSPVAVSNPNQIFHVVPVSGTGNAGVSVPGAVAVPQQNAQFLIQSGQSQTKIITIPSNAAAGALGNIAPVVVPQVVYVTARPTAAAAIATAVIGTEDEDEDTDA